MLRHYTNDRMLMQEMKQIVSIASCSKFIPLHHFTTMTGLLTLTSGVKNLLASKKGITYMKTTTVCISISDYIICLTFYDIHYMTSLQNVF
jgi:ABC-type uncharacterized transport system permease subunit